MQAEFSSLQSSLLMLSLSLGYVDTRWECAVCKLIHQRVISLLLEGEPLNTCILSIFLYTTRADASIYFYLCFSSVFHVIMLN